MHAAIAARDNPLRARLRALDDYYSVSVWGRFSIDPTRQMTLAEAQHADEVYSLSYAAQITLTAEITRTRSITLHLEPPYDSLAV